MREKLKLAPNPKPKPIAAEAAETESQPAPKRARTVVPDTSGHVRIKSTGEVEEDYVVSARNMGFTIGARVETTKSLRGVKKATIKK